MESFHSWVDVELCFYTFCIRLQQIKYPNISIMYHVIYDINMHVYWICVHEIFWWFLWNFGSTLFLNMRHSNDELQFSFFFFTLNTIWAQKQNIKPVITFFTICIYDLIRHNMWSQWTKRRMWPRGKDVFSH